MPNLARAAQADLDIRALAAQAAATLPPGSVAHQVACDSRLRPMNYMRHAEFEAVLADLSLKAGMLVLDASSPQWLCLYLAHKNPGTRFIYMNIIDRELDPFRQIAQALKLSNITYAKGDLRALDYPDHHVDLAISVSVIEHVYPEVGGDVAALRELRRVLKPDGHLVLTVPYKAQRNLVYTEGPVYERNASGKNFYAREYDRAMFDALVADSQMRVVSSVTIRERPGVLAIDALEWGWGRPHRIVKLFMRVLRRVERVLGLAIDGPLARHYMQIDSQGSGRLVNIHARLAPAAA